MKSRLDRIVSIATLVASLAAIFLVLKKPVPLGQGSAAVAQHAQSLDQNQGQNPDQKPDPRTGQSELLNRQTTGSGSLESPRFESPKAAGQTSQTQASQIQTSQGQSGMSSQSASAQAASAKPEANVNSDAISGMIAKMLGGGAASLTPDSNVGSGEPNIKEQQVTMDGDVVHGKFLTEIGGKDVWVTVSGHMGEKDGYATFDPTEFKVGDTEVPVSLVNPLLQKKLAEERDRLKVPNNSQ
jgi:hypothetical protein